VLLPYSSSSLTKLPRADPDRTAPRPHLPSPVRRVMRRAAYQLASDFKEEIKSGIKTFGNKNN
jgi:hypothetical protein